MIRYICVLDACVTFDIATLFMMPRRKRSTSIWREMSFFLRHSSATEAGPLAIQRDRDKFYQWSASWNLPLYLNKCQQLRVGEANSLRHMGHPGHPIAMKQTQQAKNFQDSR